MPIDRRLAILRENETAIGESGHAFLYAEFSPDGRRVLAASQDGTARI
jgi:hypothetical protein